MRRIRKIGFIFLTYMLFVQFHIPNVSAANNTYYISASGNDSNNGSQTAPFKTLTKAFSAASPGDTIMIVDVIAGGKISGKNGTSSAPITIKGGTIRGGSSRMLEIRETSYLIFDGITFDAKGSSTSDSTIYMLLSHHNIFRNNTIMNAGGECFRIKAFSHHNSIINNTVKNCGTTKWSPPSGKNGEGIYVGTAADQWAAYSSKDNYPAGPDKTEWNYIANNTIIPDNGDKKAGNECVDLKEGTNSNLVENNTCSGQLDKNSGGMESRGDQNIFRHNTYRSIICGAGIRFGGDNKLTQGIGNIAIENDFQDFNNADPICPVSASTDKDKTAIHGAVKIEAQPPQGYMCGNNVHGKTPIVDGTYMSNVNTGEFVGACDSARVNVIFAGKVFGAGGQTPTGQPTSPVTITNPPSGTPSSPPCPALPSDTGVVTLSVSLPTNGTYKIWSRIQGQGGGANSYWLQVDNQCGIDVGDLSSMPLGQLTWVDYRDGNATNKITMQLSGGQHSIRLIGREDNTSVDTLFFMTDMNCTPSGTGDNCSSSSPTPPVTISVSPTSDLGSTRFNFTIGLHGIGKSGDNVNPNAVGTMSPKRSSRAITMQLYNGFNQLVHTQQGSIAFNTTSGLFTGVLSVGPEVSSGVYTIKVQSPNYLRGSLSGIVNVISGQVLSLPIMHLVTGDANSDNQLSILDYNMILDCFSDLRPAHNCSLSKKEATDITDDGNVNQFDYNLFLRELSVQSGQ